MARPMTIAEKILAAHAGRDHVRPGELVTVRVDFLLANDITAPPAIEAFRAMGADRVFDPERLALVPDHFAPAKDVAAAEMLRTMARFAREMGIRYYFPLGEMGIEHVILPEHGLALPGELILGADSHTCTYGALGAFATGVGSTDLAAAMALGETWLRVPETLRISYRGTPDPWVSAKDLILYTIGRIGVGGARNQAIEFTGPVIEAMSVEGRMTMANMAVEAGAKTGLINPDATTLAYVGPRAARPFSPVVSDPDAPVREHLEFDLDGLEPQVALPHSPGNVVPLSRAPRVAVDQVFIGTCTNGRIEDLRVAARILRGRRVARGTRLLVIPGSQAVVLQAVREGLMEVFLEAGAMVSTTTCGPCIGGHMGVLAEGERAVSTNNRNFYGRMGARGAENYLASPAVAAATAVLGHLGHPAEVVGARGEVA